MNYAKVQAEIVKEILSREIKGNSKKVLYEDMVGTAYIGVLINPSYVYIVPKRYFCIDTAFMESTTMFSKIYDRSDYATDLKATGISKMTGKSVVVEYINKKGENMYVKEDYLKKFGKRDDLILRTESPKSVIHVYEKNNPFLIGYVMPVVNVNTNEKE